MSTTTASTALGGGGGAGTPPTVSTTGGSGGHAPAHMQQQYNSFTSIRNALKVQYKRLCSTIEAEGRDADDDPMRVRQWVPRWHGREPELAQSGPLRRHTV